MIDVIILCILGLVWAVFASLQDIKEREVANWLNFSLIIFALGFRFFYSLFSIEGFDFFYQGVIWFGIFFIFGNLFYYARFFAGGDAKMFIAFGTIVPFSTEFIRNLNYSIVFLIIFLFVGAIYGLSCSIYLGFKNWSVCKKEFGKQFKKNKKMKLFSILIALGLLIFSLVNFVFIYLSLLFFLFPYLYFYAKSVDETCMVKDVDSKKIREGDWLYKDVKLKNKTIESKWDGLSKKEIQLIKKSKLKKIKIREGIAFIPVFLISLVIFIALYFTKNIALLFII